MRTYGLYLSTLSTKNKPISTPITKAQVKWIINWREIFGNRTGECRVRARLISSSAASATLVWEKSIGSVRVSLGSNSANTSYGLNLGCMRPQNDFTGTNFAYLELDTTTSNGISAIIPTNNYEFCVSILDNTEALLSVAQDYQLWLYFDCDDENPLSLNDKPMELPVPQFYLPR